MSQQYTYIHDVCATCEFWAGRREFYDRYMHRITVESATVHAKCLNRDSGWFTKSAGTQAGFRCPHYQKWSLLRK